MRGNVKTNKKGYKRWLPSCVAAVLEPLYDFIGQGSFSTGTSVLNTTFVPLWASEQRWSLCCDGFGKPVWNWSSRPRSHFALGDFSQASDSEAETTTRKSRDGVREGLNTTTNSKFSLFSVTQNFHCLIQKRKLGSKGLWHHSDMQPVFPKAAVVWFFQREAVSSGRATIWPFWCSSHKSLVCLRACLPLSPFSQPKSLLRSFIKPLNHGQRLVGKTISPDTAKLQQCLVSLVFSHPDVSAQSLIGASFPSSASTWVDVSIFSPVFFIQGFSGTADRKGRSVWWWLSLTIL